MARYEVEVHGLKFTIDEELRYTQTDEWARLEGDRVTVGITDYAQQMLKDVVGVELPEVGTRVSKGEQAAVLESIKATADVYSPVSGEIVEVNERLLEEPELINQDPYGEGWILVVKVDDVSEYESLLTHEQYIDKIKKEKH